MRCLVTGVAGFVGSHLAERLLADGHEVCGIDAFIDYYPRRIKELNLERLRDWERFTFVEDDILSVNLFRLLEGVDWIFHQAAQAGVRSSWGHEFARYTECNILATQRLLEAAAHVRRLRRFVYASSSSVYGEPTTLPVTEQVMPQPVSPYGVTKLAAEHLCVLYHRNFGVPTVALRYFTVYGPRQRPDMAFHRFCKAILDHEAIRVFGDGLQTRDFTYISDVVEANIQAAGADGVAGEVMNIAGGARVTVRSVLEMLQEVSGAPIAIDYDNRQPGDVLDTFADTTRARQLMHYQPRVGLREGLAAEFEQIVSLYERVRR
ncbi:MAG TPA: GDP-mannose 4,6-dehydratase [Ktedonobacteraceae bacterium]|nr:GDP-mannose 4,6-dehydratase [Ktedonobacteraceae bacterium]